jgi:hypothetical protein
VLGSRPCERISQGALPDDLTAGGPARVLTGMGGVRHGPEPVCAQPAKHRRRPCRSRSTGPGGRCRRDPVAAEDEHRGRSADAGTDGQLSERHHRDQHGDGVEEGGVSTPTACSSSQLRKIWGSSAREFDQFAGLPATESAGLRLESAAAVGSSYTLPLGLLRFLLPFVVHTPVEEASRKVSRVRDQREGPGRMISTPTVQRAESRTPESS